MRSESRQRSFVLGRVALRQLLGGILKIAPSDVQLDIRDDGRVVAIDTSLHVSISHSADRAVAVASKRCVGVDLERIVSKPEKLLEYILHDEERPHVEELALEPDQKLFLCWTLKEAALKGSGSGLRMGPRSVRIRVDLEHETAVIRDGKDRLWNALFEFRDDFLLAVAFDPTH